MNNNSFVMAGSFPPPVLGMAAVNASVRDALRKAGITPLVIDLAAPSLDRSIASRLSRLPRVLRGMVQLGGRRDLVSGTLYISISGGLGQLYELAFILLARLRGMRLFLHHHSFSYLDTPGMLTRALILGAGGHAVHLTQSPKMACCLQNVYRANRVIPISNAVFFVVRNMPAVTRTRLSSLGFLGNISAEKGVFEFLDLVEAALNLGLPVRAKLAGPFQDAATERAVRARLALLPQAEYVGPQYGAYKDAFYADIDVLVFPTRYKNETEGIVNHEAMSRGIPVIAYGRGCIPEIVGTDCGLVIDPVEAFVPAALTKIQSWLADPAAFAAASYAAAARFAHTHNENEARWRELFAELTGSALASEPTSGTGGCGK